MGNSSSKQKNTETDTTIINQRRKKRIKERQKKIELPEIYPKYECKLHLLKQQTLTNFLKIENKILGKIENSDDNENKITIRKLVDQIRGTPMLMGTLEEFVDDNNAIVSQYLGPEYVVQVMSFVDATKLEPGCSVLLNYRDCSVVGVFEGDDDPTVSNMKISSLPKETYADIGGLEKQIQEIKESVELPLTDPDLFRDMGIDPPKGVILYGQPGTGKTLLAKAVANATSATFLRIVGSELVKKYLGEGPKLVRDVFKMAEDCAPSIIFIDEIDAIGRKRRNVSSSGGQEIQRTLLELLNQLDGFDKKADIKVIMATNLISSLDPALIRPGRIDRKIEFTMPNVETKLKIFKIHTNTMNLEKDVDLMELVASKEDLSGADIKGICTEAGMKALRDGRSSVIFKDFIYAREKVFSSKKSALPENLYS
ncbi:uncharacterized protein [Lepeophtheirus salmonis]|uniref:uncharacterized protein n=1 Tax=Lepeophtheirus salmonis TaxID=72036 RepID=UPI003AF3D2C6